MDSAETRRRLEAAPLRRRIEAWTLEWGATPHHGVLSALALLNDCAAALPAEPCVENATQSTHGQWCGWCGGDCRKPEAHGLEPSDGR